MFRIEISAPPESNAWVDHLGKEITGKKLTFSKAYQASYAPGSGHYPLESAGSLYRNIDNIRESPLQSRTDWEIRVPSIYSSADGEHSFVDLLYELEAVNEEHGKEFDLIGCAADLFADENPIYSGVVESIANGSGTASIRISDWLGNPKIGKKLPPARIGVARSPYWPVKVTRMNGYIKLETSDEPLRDCPTFHVKIGEAYLPVRIAENVLRDIGYMNFYILDEGTLDIEKPYSLPIDIYGDDELVLPSSEAIAFDLLLYAYVNKYRRDVLKDTPDYFVLGKLPDFETVEAWSSRFTAEGIGNNIEGYSLGRPSMGERPFKHYKGEKLSAGFNSRDARLIFDISLRPSTLVAYGAASVEGPPFTAGNPSQFIAQSQKDLEEGDAIVPCSPKNPCPIIRVFSAGAVYGSKLLMMLINPLSQFTITFACPADAPGNAKTRFRGVHLYLGLRYRGVSNELKYSASFTVAGIKTDLPPEMMDGKVRKFTVYNSGHLDLSSVLKITFNFQLNPCFYYSKFFLREIFEQVENIQVLYARLECEVEFPLGSNKLYAAGKFASQEPAAEGDDEAMTVKPAIRRLLGEAKKNACEVEPDAAGDSSLLFGTVLSEAFALRDKLRSLAAESSTLISFNPKKTEIKASSIALQNDSLPIRIKLDAFVLENNAYAFEMETPDRSELISELEINWGKDFEEKEYAHVFSVSANGIKEDGKPASSLLISGEKWSRVWSRIARNSKSGIGEKKIVDSEWITSSVAAESMAYNMLRWNAAPMRKAQARCIFPVLKNYGAVDIGAFVSFALPGYPDKFLNTSWVVTGRHDNLDTMVTTLELLEVCDLPAVPPNGYLLLEDGSNMLFENNGKIKLEDFYV